MPNRIPPSAQRMEQGVDENSGNALAAREALRRARISAREALDADEHRRRSEAIAAHLERLLRSCRPRTLGFCWPIRSEFDCRPLAARLATEGVRCGLPRIAEDSATMTFHEWRPGSAMETGRHGIPAPKADAPRLLPDLLLIPVNAFDTAGYRLGYGAGYFDRTLAALDPRPLAVGVGFALARVASIDPAPHDVPLDAVVTEAGIERFSARLPAGDAG